MNRKLQVRLKASTMPEVLIAMMILLTAFTIAMVVYSRLLGGGVSLTSQQAYAQMESIIITSAGMGQDFVDEIKVIDNIEYRKTFIPYGTGLSIIQIEAIQHGLPVGKLRKIIRDDQF